VWRRRRYIPGCLACVSGATVSCGFLLKRALDAFLNYTWTKKLKLTGRGGQEDNSLIPGHSSQM
jgi:hypothetical protein